MSDEDRVIAALEGRLAALNAENAAMLAATMPSNSAFVFIKPHAVTDECKTMVKAKLEAAGLAILKEGSIASEEIDSKKLIDQHYYAIASKATILKPHELAVPEDKFEEKFGLPWKKALEDGTVYNAMDAAEYLGLDAAGLETEWRKTKPNDKVIKFGGGFYCGLIDTVEGKDPIYW